MNVEGRLDLDYADPPASPQLLEQARRRGRSIRRRRRMSAATCAVVLIAGGTVGLQSLPGDFNSLRRLAIGPARAVPVTPQDLAKLPVASGQGPAASRFTTDGDGAGGDASLPAGPVTVVASGPGEQNQVLLWVSNDARFVVGNRNSPDAVPQPSVSRALDDLPDEGLWGGMVFSDNTVSPGTTGKARTIVAGLVRGSVSKVLIGLPGGAVPAHLEPTLDPQLGTIYWFVTDAFDSSGAVDPSAADPTFGKDTSAITRTVYRGNAPTFHCQGPECLGLR